MFMYTDSWCVIALKVTQLVNNKPAIACRNRGIMRGKLISSASLVMILRNQSL